MESDGWNGLFAPGKTPREIINRLSMEASAAAKHPDSVKRLTELAAEPIGSTPEEQDAILRKQLTAFRQLTQHMKFE